MNGIILGYRVLYRREDKPFTGFDNVTLNSTSFHVEITGLEFFTKYEIRLFGFTIAGDGNMSEPLFCVTDESGSVCIFCFSQYIRNGNSFFRWLSSLWDRNHLETPESLVPKNIGQHIGIIRFFCVYTSQSASLELIKNQLYFNFVLAFNNS